MQDELLISKREILAILFRHAWSGAIVFASTMLVAVFLLFYLISPAYESDAVVILNNSFLTHPLRDAPPDSDLEKMVTFHTQRDIIESTRLAIEVVERTKLHEFRTIDRLERIGILIGDIKRFVGGVIGIERWTKPWDPEAAAVAAVDDWVETFAIPDSKTLMVTFRAKDPNEAQLVLQTLMEAFSDYYYGLIRKKAQGVVKFLEQEYNESAEELRNAELALLEFKQEDRLDSGELSKKTGLKQEDFPSFAGITDSAKIQDELRLYVLSLEEEYRLASQILDNKKREREQHELRKRIDVYLDVINSLPEREIRFVRLQRKYETAQDDVLTLGRNLDRARIVADGQTEAMRLVDIFEPPLVNESPVFPRKKTGLVLAAVFGMVLALTWIFLIDYMDHTIRSPNDIRRHLGLRNLGSVKKLR